MFASIATAARPRIVAAAVTTPRAVAATSAVTGAAGIRVCAGERELDECFARYDVSCLVTEIGHRARVEILSRLILRTESSHIVVIVPGRLPVAEVLSLCRGGVRFQLAHDPDEVSALMRLLMTYPAGESEISTVMRALPGALGREEIELILGLLILGRRRTTVRAASARLGKPAGLRKVLHDRSLPKAARLLGWGAALGVMWQMDRFHFDLSDASRAHGFATVRQCADAFKYHTGRAPVVVLRDGGFSGLLGEFVSFLGKTRRS